MTQAAILAASGSPGVSTGFKNRIINGDMRIMQRWLSGSTWTSATTQYYGIDRWAWNQSNGNVAILGQNLDSLTPPTGFTYYQGYRCTSAVASPTAPNNIMTVFEGLNMEDLGWGTSSGKTLTLSFWVYVTVAGNYSVTFNNPGGTQVSYCQLYNVPTANTWTFITIQIPPPPVGSTWVTTNNNWGYIFWGLGQGTSVDGTNSTSWQSGFLYNTVGSVNVLGAVGRAFYMTGVQLEVGTTATNFDYRPLGVEQMLCQRYYWKIWGNGGTANQYGGMNASGVVESSTTGRVNLIYPVPMRAIPTFTQSTTELYDGGHGVVSSIQANGSGSFYGTNAANVQLITSASLGTGHGCVWIGANASNNQAFIDANAEL